MARCCHAYPLLCCQGPDLARLRALLIARGARGGAKLRQAPIATGGAAGAARPGAESRRVGARSAPEAA
jgi:hypothetical protein